MSTIAGAAALALGCSSGSGGGGALDGGSGSGGASGGGGFSGSAGSSGAGGGAGVGGGGATGVTVSGTIQLVNAPAGSAPSVILAPSSGFNPAAAHPGLPTGPSGTTETGGTWSIPNVPDGSYYVLVSFENDGLVLDPETTFAVVNVAGADVSAGDAKLTSAQEIVAPDGEATVSSPITFQWTDSAGEDGYGIEVVDEIGQVVWQSTAGANETSMSYSGPQLASGALYQWRLTATSGGYPSSRSEDLRGTFRPQ